MNWSGFWIIIKKKHWECILKKAPSRPERSSLGGYQALISEHQSNSIWIYFNDQISSKSNFGGNCCGSEIPSMSMWNGSCLFERMNSTRTRSIDSSGGNSFWGLFWSEIVFWLESPPNQTKVCQTTQTREPQQKNHFRISNYGSWDSFVTEIFFV